MLRWIARIALGLWLAAVIGIGTSTTLLHGLTLPLPALPRAAVADGYRVLHGLDAECPCSQRVIDYLVGRGATAGAAEQVLLVNGDAAEAARLGARGFDVRLVGEQQLAQEFGIHAAPSVAILRPDGTVAYQGAYAPRPQMDPIDVELLDRARQGESIASLPILGCAVSRALQDRLDPFGFKYGWR